MCYGIGKYTLFLSGVRACASPKILQAGAVKGLITWHKFICFHNEIRYATNKQVSLSWQHCERQKATLLSCYVAAAKLPHVFATQLTLDKVVWSTKRVLTANTCVEYSTGESVHFPETTYAAATLHMIVALTAKCRFSERFIIEAGKGISNAIRKTALNIPHSEVLLSTSLDWINNVNHVI